MKKAVMAVVVGLLLSSVLGGCARRCGEPVCAEPCKSPCAVMKKEYVCK
jgi:hypothetical protein